MLGSLTSRQAGDESEDDPADLIRRISESRDRAALAQLFLRFGPRIKSMMLKLGVSGTMAEDLVQETLLTVWRKAGLYSPAKGAVATWVFTIARNLRIDHLRRQSNKPYVDYETLNLESPTRPGILVVEEKQIVARVSKAITTLSPEQQEVVRLSFIFDLPHAEIATRVGIPLGTVKSRLRLAYDRLRPLLEDLQ